ncbi:protease modulator HflC [Desulfovibrio sp. OttesenSCG-928-A18]|nr:protease modulator HflC [Desulfovibrio sp. OttesenSCG-928-A18]
MNRKLLIIMGSFIFLLFLGTQCIFFVAENERAIVLQLGEAVEENAREAGINFKLPFIQSVIYFEKRILLFEIEKTKSLTADLKFIEIDNYVCWRITDPIVFYRKLGTVADATVRLHSIVYSQLLTSIASTTLTDIVSPEPEKESGAPQPAALARRSAIMEAVLAKADKQAAEYGVSIVDVRIKRVELPNRQAIYKRMIAERLRMANKYRYEGESEKLRIRSEAEMTRDSTLADAYRESTIIRGEADARAMDIFAKAVGQDPDFYEFYKSLELYRKSFSQNAKFIFSSDDPLLKHMK